MSERTITKTTFTGMMLLSALTAGAMTATGLSGERHLRVVLRHR